MTRYALGIEYDGTDFQGWQAQPHGRTVQAALEAAVAAVADAEIRVHVAGRTDTGVHASHQVAHFDSAAVRDERQWLLGINGNLPDDVCVSWIRAVTPAFDARRSATARRYQYLVVRGRARPVLLRRRVWWIRDSLDCAAMTRASLSLLGEHDFSAFRAAGCQSRSPMRYLSRVGFRNAGELLSLEFTANAFLYHMVRNIVGLLVEIGRGRQSPQWAAEVLAGRDRTRAAPTAPALGLTLIDVAYPPKFDLPRPRETPLVL